MVTRELVKSEVDRVQSKYLDKLHRFIQTLIPASEQQPENNTRITGRSRWQKFIKETYGILADSPIERGEQGQYEHREHFE